MKNRNLCVGGILGLLNIVAISSFPAFAETLDISAEYENSCSALATEMGEQMATAYGDPSAASLQRLLDFIEELQFFCPFPVPLIPGQPLPPVQWFGGPMVPLGESFIPPTVPSQLPTGD